MRWEDERFVKVYTRDTPEWCVLSWEARGVFLLLIRAVDRAGIVPLGPAGAKGLAALLRVPVDVIVRVLAELAEDGCLLLYPDRVVVPNFCAAQEARQSDKARARTARERARASSLLPDGGEEEDKSQNVTPPSQNVTRESRGVTPPSHAVTPRHTASLSDQIRLDQTKKNVGEAATAAPGGEPPGSLVSPPGEEREPDPDPGEVAQVPLTLTASPGGAEVAPRRDIPAEVHRAYLDGWTRYVGKGTPPTLDAKRRKLILARSKDFTPEELCDAARGAWASEWHREEHGKRMRLDQVYANTGRVEQFIAALAPAPIRTSDNGGYGRVIDRPAPPRYIPKVEPMTPKFPNLFGLPGTLPPAHARRQGSTS